jgi:putative Ca2+/H+ antiporter (TMEM165/GDT1 family)
MSAFLLSFALIFLAELGDKSQLVALWFATRYHWAVVLLGVTIATLTVHLASTAIGATVADVLPEAVVLGIVGLSFYAFALWGLRGDKLDEDPTREAQTVFGALFVVSTAFFLSELGDKTQLATVSIASERDGFFGVWLGSTAGMVTADALAIVVGIVMGKRLPERAVAVVAAVLFAVFGTVAIVRAILVATE